MKIHFVSLGCARNLVDSEMMLGRLVAGGHRITSDLGEADCVIINTCGFIRSAVDESIDMILEMAEWKREIAGRRLVVVGCLPQRYGRDLVESLPEVDMFLGPGAFEQIETAVCGAADTGRLQLPEPARSPLNSHCVPRLRATPKHQAYLKIAEGCSGRCTYCIIPKLRGPHRSRPMEDVLAEAEALVEAGVMELVLIAQNTSRYGLDLGTGYGLAELLHRLGEIPGLPWVRVLYGHPAFMTDEIIEAVAAHRNVLPYFDIPLQHVSPSVLKRMGRPADPSKLSRLFARIRRTIPDAILRTTFIVGFPGETEDDFTRLLEFIDEIRVDHLGAFIYSDEKDLPSSRLSNHVPPRVQQKRYDRLMQRQAILSRERNQSYVGQVLQILVEGPGGEPCARLVGRAPFQAPEVDGVVVLAGREARPGELVPARITAAREYDLEGVVL